MKSSHWGIFFLVESWLYNLQGMNRTLETLGLLLVLDLMSFCVPRKFCCRTLECKWCKLSPGPLFPPSFELQYWSEDTSCSNCTWVLMLQVVCVGILDCNLLWWCTPFMDLHLDLPMSSRSSLIFSLLDLLGFWKEKRRIWFWLRFWGLSYGLQKQAFWSCLGWLKPLGLKSDCLSDLSSFGGH